MSHNVAMVMSYYIYTYTRNDINTYKYLCKYIYFLNIETRRKYDIKYSEILFFSGW